jgi:hypothetical protein
MKQRILYFLIVLFLPVALMAQTPGNVPKDAKIDVSIQNASNGKMLNNEIVVFKSRANGIEYQIQPGNFLCACLLAISMIILY